MADKKSKEIGKEIRRVGMIFSGGPAPAANAVISSAAISFLDSGREVVGFLGGYSHLQNYHPLSHRLQRDTHYRNLVLADVVGTRNRRGIIIGTARANPGKLVESPDDLDDPDKVASLRNIYFALVDLGVDALISIGGDDTLRTANLLYEFQKRLPADAARVRLVHLPKTIDNDYEGIDFTFGYFTAVAVLADELKNLRADAEATNSYFVAETMGRKSGWLAYGVGIAGEANMIFSVEDIDGTMLETEAWTNPETGKKEKVRKLKVEALVNKICQMMAARQSREGKGYGTIVIAEGLVEMLPTRFIDDMPRDPHGHISAGDLDIGKIIAKEVSQEYERRTGRVKKVKGLQLGYEARCAQPLAFDVMLGSQLGIGAYRALIEEGLDGHMVSVAGQLDLRYVAFEKLVDPTSLRTTVRYIEPGCDFHLLARFLETKVESIER
jgi:ATP-dependent phosphofructokinase / diphosphate-dependent phosphofructokinase